MTLVDPDRWIVLRRRVAIAGRVVDDAGVPADGGDLSMRAQPPATPPRRTARRGADAPPMNHFARLHETRVRSDGFYFFLDLPAGDDLIDGRDARGRAIEPRSISIAPVVGPAAKRLLGVNLVTRK